MSTLTNEKTGAATGSASGNRLFAVVAILAIVVGLGSVAGGLGGMVYTWQNAAVENITTPGDAVRPGIDVRGPISMWVQADIIEKHQLARTDGLRFAEMPRQIQRVDEDGNPMVNEAGEPVMGPNVARDSWVNATSLMTVLNLGLMAYMLSLFAIVMGATVAGLGWVVLRLSRSPALV